MKIRFNKALLFFFVFFISASATLAGEYMQADAAIGIDSNVSDGKYSILEISNIASRNNIKVLVLTDSFSMRWQYGLWPFRNVLKKTVENNSVSGYGIKRYLNEIECAQKAHPQMQVVAGLEVSPFYYWQGSIFRDNLRIKDWHKQFLVIGLDSLSSYRMLPVIGNKRGLAGPFSAKGALCLFVPLFMLLAGVFILYKIISSPDFYYDIRLKTYSKGKIFAGLLLFLLGALFLLNNFPFRDCKFDQYTQKAGVTPYQNLIDYVDAKGGLTFWSHPEARNVDSMGTVNIETGDFSEDLLLTENYTGFAILHAGYEKIGRPQGIWDELLTQYCQGLRKRPVFAIGELDYEREGDLSDYLRDLRTVLLVRELDKKEALLALKNGRMYVKRNAPYFVLDKFTLKDEASGVEKTYGERIKTGGKVKIKIAGRFLKANETPLSIALIKDGEIVEFFNESAPFEISYEDTIEKGKMSYYRAEIKSDNALIVTNPIFVRND